jgi:hypothetical protein
MRAPRLSAGRPRGRLGCPAGAAFGHCRSETVEPSDQPHVGSFDMLGVRVGLDLPCQVRHQPDGAHVARDGIGDQPIEDRVAVADLPARPGRPARRAPRPAGPRCPAPARPPARVAGGALGETGYAPVVLHSRPGRSPRRSAAGCARARLYFPATVLVICIIHRDNCVYNIFPIGHPLHSGQIALRRRRNFQPYGRENSAIAGPRPGFAPPRPKLPVLGEFAAGLRRGRRQTGRQASSRKRPKPTSSQRRGMARAMYQT